VAPSALLANASGLYFADAVFFTLRFLDSASGRIFTAAGNGSLAAGFYPAFPIAAGTTLEIRLLIVNAGTGPADVKTPALIPMLAATPLGARAFAIVRRVPGLPALLAGPGTPEGAPASDPALRTSWGFWNTDEEVARMVELITLFAAHTPETLPKRPKIDILHG
jgi:hypothetical protein